MAKIKNKQRALSVRFAGCFVLASMCVSTVQARPMETTGLTTQPIGHHTFCQALPQECQRTGSAQPELLDQKKWRTMVSLNNRINATITPLTDMEIWGINELWSYPETVGDCEDYVLLKRHALMQAGFKASNLLITVVRQANGDGHAVLTVRTTKGDFVLDNLRDEVRAWQDTEYTYLKRQSTNHAGRWENIEDSRAQLTASR